MININDILSYMDKYCLYLEQCGETLENILKKTDVFIISN